MYLSDISRKDPIEGEFEVDFDIWMMNNVPHTFNNFEVLFKQHIIVDLLEDGDQKLRIDWDDFYDDMKEINQFMPYQNSFLKSNN